MATLVEFTKRLKVPFTWPGSCYVHRLYSQKELQYKDNTGIWRCVPSISIGLALRDDLVEIQQPVTVERWSFAVKCASGNIRVYENLTYAKSAENRDAHENAGNRCSEIQRVEYTIK